MLQVGCAFAVIYLTAAIDIKTSPLPTPQRPIFTYCLGILTHQGLVMASDSSTNAGYHQINLCRKMHTFVVPGERALVILTSVSLTTRPFRGVVEGLAKADSFYYAARVVGTTVRRVSKTSVAPHSKETTTPSARVPDAPGGMRSEAITQILRNGGNCSLFREREHSQLTGSGAHGCSILRAFWRGVGSCIHSPKPKSSPAPAAPHP